MIGLVLVTHGRLAAEFASALEHVVGPQDAVATVCIAPDDDMEAKRRAIIDGIQAVDHGHGVAILTDMFGGTPSNLAMSVLGEGRIEVVAGLNLPMLIKLARLRAQAPLESAVRQAQEAGRKYISVATQFLEDGGHPDSDGTGTERG